MIVDFETAGRALTTGLFFATLAFVVVALLWSYVVVRRIPMEVLQLRVFARLPDVANGALVLAVGTVVGMVTLIPLMVGTTMPIAWDLGGASTWAGFTWIALGKIVRILRFPAAVEARRPGERGA